METNSEQRLKGTDFRRLEVTRRKLLQVAGVSTIAFGGGALSTGCAPPADELIDALCDTFIPGDASIPGVGPGAIEGGMRCLMGDIMGWDNLNLVTEAMGLLYPDFPYLPYAQRAGIMEEVRRNPDLSDIFYGLHEATAVAFYSELMGKGPTPCGDPSFPGTYPLMGVPKFQSGVRIDQFDCET